MSAYPKGKLDSVITEYFNVEKSGNDEYLELNDKESLFFNAKGLLIEDWASDYGDAEEGAFKDIYVYDSAGNYSQELRYSSKGKLTGNVSYSFDPVRRLVETKTVNTIRGRMLLDKAGNILEDITYNEYPIAFSTTRFKYNYKGLCTESYQTWTNSTDMQKITYFYNADNDLIKEVVINDGKLLVTKTYSYEKFDKMHNWLIQKMYSNGRLSNVSERKIAYRK